jgi:hypothetical protein
MTAEREMVLGLQPAVVSAAEPVEGSKFDHGMFLYSIDPWDKYLRFVHK